MLTSLLTKNDCPRQHVAAVYTRIRGALLTMLTRRCCSPRRAVGAGACKLVGVLAQMSRRFRQRSSTRSPMAGLDCLSLLTSLLTRRHFLFVNIIE